MGDKQKLIAKKISFQGMFDYSSLFRIMDVWLRDKFYDKWEKRSEEYVNPDGTKNIDLEFTPWKKFTDYHKIIMKIELWVMNMKDVEVTVHGKKQVVQEGRVDVKFTGYLVVDYEGNWNSPLQFFLRDLWDRYVVTRITNKYEKLVVDHVNDLANTMQAHLNMHQYRTGF